MKPLFLSHKCDTKLIFPSISLEGIFFISFPANVHLSLPVFQRPDPCLRSHACKLTVCLFSYTTTTDTPPQGFVLVTVCHYSILYTTRLLVAATRKQLSPFRASLLFIRTNVPAFVVRIYIHTDSMESPDMSVLMPRVLQSNVTVGRLWTWHKWGN